MEGGSSEMQTFDGFLFLSADGIPYNSMNSRLSNSAVYMGMNGASFQGGNLIKDHCSSVSLMLLMLLTACLLSQCRQKIGKKYLVM